jgi:hypothetical protein
MQRAATGVVAGGQTARQIETAADQAPGQPESRDQVLAALQERFPGWRVWYVLCYVGPTAWCARHGSVHLKKDSPEWLAGAIEEADAEAAGS